MVSLKQFVTSEVYRDFKAYLEEHILLLHKSLEVARTPDDMYRIQGQIFALRKLQSMKEELLKRDK